MSDVLRNNTSLVKLSLRGRGGEDDAGDYMGDEGAEELSDALRENSTLTSLDLSCVS